MAYERGWQNVVTEKVSLFYSKNSLTGVISYKRKVITHFKPAEWHSCRTWSAPCPPGCRRSSITTGTWLNTGGDVYYTYFIENKLLKTFPVCFLKFCVGPVRTFGAYCSFFLDTIFGGFTVFYCDTTLDVHKCTEVAPFSSLLLLSEGTPRVPRPGIEPRTYQMAEAR